MLENLQQMVILAAIGHEQNFTRAADRLGISKSQVSKQVRYLEERLGCQLVQRSTRTVALTEIGLQYADYGQQLVDTVNEAEAMVAGYRNEIKGVLRIGIAQSFGNIHITSALAEFQKTNPELELEISLFDHRPNLLEEGFDCWIAIHEHPPEGMVARKLANCEFVVVASPDYIAQHGQPETPSDLRRHNCITYQSRERKYVNWAFSRDGVQQSIRVRGNYRIDNAPAVLDAAVSGLGIAYLSTYLMTNELENNKLIQLLPQWKTTVDLPIYAVYPRRKYLAPKVRCFIDFMAERMAQAPYKTPRPILP
ncbi:LysR family transcriptional regulator [Photobacterium iliopiscarium]|jgi:DNA-binding transcriptional LysR family regulator|uniref:LysR family transcriptional regulator n=1 Tax=Photobacterium iliopiscarium TaxID=56192 RepID=A0ABX5GS00_9GAMM|nr:LysR family transcriptional regulator [Photobacterium iliopiscarium]KJG13511.1 LysR family transcriptional regulator [Photobacterium iliopiscarium]KJG22720.1 LysR family transcriptional regulator [Photobacterium iliopiscarium]PSU01025.1 LysR family transcriptional regulator [Photobacterium iliopiscarium]PSV82834.1 LysR family transcriptional regulator [Photobacterium iliopiscarium]PSW95721.1 LysR family transcriptional regulator [Photobacterium iliopiscarium]